MTDLAHYTGAATLPSLGDTGSALIARAVEQMGGAYQIAQAIAKTAFVPQHFRGKPDDISAAIMYGAAVGLDPMSSLRAIYVVNGSPGLYAKHMVAIAQNAGHEVWTEEASDDSVTVCGRRRGSTHVERDTWTYARAKKAGYTSNKKYDTDPQAMLYARAASVVVRRIASDVLAGLDTSVEELRVIDVDAEVVRPPRESATSLLGSAPAAAEPEKPAAPSTEDAPLPSITQAQQKKMGALMREAGIADRAAALAYVHDVIGRAVSSRAELTKSEAGAVIDALEAGTAQQSAEPEPPGVADGEVFDAEAYDEWAREQGDTDADAADPQS